MSGNAGCPIQQWTMDMVRKVALPALIHTTRPPPLSRRSPLPSNLAGGDPSLSLPSLFVLPSLLFLHCLPFQCAYVAAADGDSSTVMVFYVCNICCVLCELSFFLFGLKIQFSFVSVANFGYFS